MKTESLYPQFIGTQNTAVFSLYKMKFILCSVEALKKISLHASLSYLFIWYISL